MRETRERKKKKKKKKTRPYSRKPSHNTRNPSSPTATNTVTAPKQPSARPWVARSTTHPCQLSKMKPPLQQSAPNRKASSKTGVQTKQRRHEPPARTDTQPLQSRDPKSDSIQTHYFGDGPSPLSKSNKCVLKLKLAITCSDQDRRPDPVKSGTADLCVVAETGLAVISGQVQPLVSTVAWKQNRTKFNPSLPYLERSGSLFRFTKIGNLYSVLIETEQTKNGYLGTGDLLHRLVRVSKLQRRHLTRFESYTSGSTPLTYTASGLHDKLLLQNIPGLLELVLPAQEAANTSVSLQPATDQVACLPPECLGCASDPVKSREAARSCGTGDDPHCCALVNRNPTHPGKSLNLLFLFIIYLITLESYIFRSDPNELRYILDWLLGILYVFYSANLPSLPHIYILKLSVYLALELCGTRCSYENYYLPIIKLLTELSTRQRRPLALYIDSMWLFPVFLIIGITKKLLTLSYMGTTVKRMHIQVCIGFAFMTCYNIWLLRMLWPSLNESLLRSLEWPFSLLVSNQVQSSLFISLMELICRALVRFLTSCILLWYFSLARCHAHVVGLKSLTKGKDGLQCTQLDSNYSILLWSRTRCVSHTLWLKYLMVCAPSLQCHPSQEKFYSLPPSRNCKDYEYNLYYFCIFVKYMELTVLDLLTCIVYITWDSLFEARTLELLLKCTRTHIVSDLVMYKKNTLRAFLAWPDQPPRGIRTGAWLLCFDMGDNPYNRNSHIRTRIVYYYNNNLYYENH